MAEIPLNRILITTEVLAGNDYFWGSNNSQLIEVMRMGQAQYCKSAKTTVRSRTLGQSTRFHTYLAPLVAVCTTEAWLIIPNLHMRQMRGSLKQKPNPCHATAINMPIKPDPPGTTPGLFSAVLWQ